MSMIETNMIWMFYNKNICIISFSSTKVSDMRTSLSVRTCVSTTTSSSPIRCITSCRRFVPSYRGLIVPIRGTLVHVEQTSSKTTSPASSTMLLCRRLKTSRDFSMTPNLNANVSNSMQIFDKFSLVRHQTRVKVIWTAMVWKSWLLTINLQQAHNIVLFSGLGSYGY